MFINPKTDFAFKKIFGSQQSKDILISFLDAILYQSTSAIADLKILDPYQAPRIQGIKDSFLDVKATLRGGQTVIIEMQVLNVLGFDKRVLYNAAKAFSIQLDVGEDYTMLNPIIALTITDFEMFPHSPKVISSYALREKEELTSYSDDIELVFVELPKFQKGLDSLSNLSDKWIYFLKNASTLRSVPPTMQSESALNHAFAIAEQSRLTKDELEILEKREMFLHDNRNAIRYAEQKGRQEGRKETMIEIARQLLDVLDAETISVKTGLTLAEIQALRSPTLSA
ncbi:MAG: Rpn family recombination-promoting nuclease/putative transposase [Alkalinema sp. RU_4_3]|nr:Rpn family recombination-promoting nuclease/putative transposase [Alkalinema sp. RU_4_3]